MPQIVTPLSELLQSELKTADYTDRLAVEALQSGDSRIDVPTSGKIVASAYEQLRNAAEYSEEHLLLQRAIKRFYRRNFFVLRRNLNGLSQELITELILAGYLQNGSVGTAATQEFDRIADAYFDTLEALKKLGVGAETATKWVMACFATDIEMRLRPHSRNRALMAVTFQHFLRSVDREQFRTAVDYPDYELCLYIAVHQAILKSDIDIVRADIRSMYMIDPQQAEAFMQLNQRIDRLFGSALTAELRRLVGNYGAPFRILKAMILSRTDLPELLGERENFLDAFRWQISQEYSSLEKRLNAALVKSIVFIFITKMLIGVALEVPYDLLRHGFIAWLPLTVNLIAPPVYMALLRFSVSMPRRSHAEELTRAIDGSLYGAESKMIVHRPKQKIGYARQLVYTVLFGVPIALMFVALYALRFNWLQMVIFFVFFSTASSLAFRLNGQARELEMTHRSSGLFASIRDFIQMPFIVMGQWLSSKYQQFNIISRILDLIIELPLKVVLRLIRQWIRFFDEQREQLY
jgi:hypothetical protein